jgi:hypothetical protein
MTDQGFIYKWSTMGVMAAVGFCDWYGNRMGWFESSASGGPVILMLFLNMAGLIVAGILFGIYRAEADHSPSFFSQSQSKLFNLLQNQGLGVIVGATIMWVIFWFTQMMGWHLFRS